MCAGTLHAGNAGDDEGGPSAHVEAMTVENETSHLKLDFALAVNGGEMGIVKNILAAYPDALAWDDVMGGTALRKAVAHGSPKMEVVRFLIDRGSDINAQD